MNLTCRSATEQDIPSILKIYSQPAIDDGQVLALDEAKKIFATIKDYPSYTLHVAEVDRVIVGTIAVLIMDNLGHLGKKSAVFEDIAVLPEWQGKGIGRQMLHFAMTCCREAGCYKVTLSADQKRDKAHRFYESLGFRLHGFSFCCPLDL